MTFFIKKAQTLTAQDKGAFRTPSVLLSVKHLFWQTARSLPKKDHRSLPEKLKPALYSKGLLQTQCLPDVPSASWMQSKGMAINPCKNGRYLPQKLHKHPKECLFTEHCGSEV